MSTRPRQHDPAGRSGFYTRHRRTTRRALGCRHRRRARRSHSGCARGYRAPRPRAELNHGKAQEHDACDSAHARRVADEQERRARDDAQRAASHHDDRVAGDAAQRATALPQLQRHRERLHEHRVQHGAPQHGGAAVRRQQPHGARERPQRLKRDAVAKAGEPTDDRRQERNGRWAPRGDGGAAARVVVVAHASRERHKEGARSVTPSRTGDSPNRKRL